MSTPPYSSALPKEFGTPIIQDKLATGQAAPRK